ncbi:DUF1642 domain-containing protein [Lactococcus cremoris]|uniref:DUF1642 domain-containing protein n=1 Tax=Lactococcus lactis subsp. cremoris TaxID=1359 RepID=UPI0024A65D6B|nr:DUF1642 domain-containing protein [Lactococcus cremoris]
MTKFEEDLNRRMDLKEVPMYFTQSGCSMTRKTYIETNWVFDTYKNWHSDKEFRKLEEIGGSFALANKNLIDANTKLAEEIANLKSQPQQQALPVVPECVAEFIESYKDRRTIYGVFDKISKNRKTYPKLYEWVFEDENSQATFALAFITGKYEVEKPQLFYIALPKVYGLSDSTFVSKAESGIISEFTRGKDYALKLTEQEIKSIDERYWQFAVPVEDGE